MASRCLASQSWTMAVSLTGCSNGKKWPAPTIR